MIKTHYKPLLVFCIIACILFAFDYWRTSAEKDAIVIDQGVVDDVVAQAQRLAGRALNGAEKKYAIERYIREQILLREAYALNLNEDAIIQQRLIKKMEYILAEKDNPPQESVLREYYGLHAQKFLGEDLFTIEQIFISESEETPKDLLSLVRDSTRPEKFGTTKEASRFPYRMENVSAKEIGARLGAHVAAAVEALTPSRYGEWMGPFISPHGNHVLRIITRSPAPVEPFDKVEHLVKSTYMNEQREAMINDKIAVLKKKYRIYSNITDKIIE